MKKQLIIIKEKMILITAKKNDPLLPRVVNDGTSLERVTCKTPLRTVGRGVCVFVRDRLRPPRRVHGDRGGDRRRGKESDR